MNTQEVLQHVTTPLANPAYAPVVPRFTNREYLNIVYRTDFDALRAVVPEPLEIEEPLVRFEVMKMGDVSGYGPYTESGQAIPVTFDGERGEYLHAMYLDNFAATASGREISAYPKTVGAPNLYADNGTLVGTLDYGTLRVATATMGYKHNRLDPREAEAQITVPTFMLKIIPDYDGSPRVNELVRTEITDVVVKEAWTGPARLQLFEHVLAPLADLPVREVVSASHILTDLTLAPVKPVYDYLKEARS
ncbi:acetoacetate decarboxylase [Amycolatopsis xylanica]|uniref:Acetoacetate decarboxylase n=1 Tax=Amycolatopsis xylanica TaxID=589385 RepID=A0A1H3GQ13_9PSEU|nr:acetoacetate decarboxylase [Amycolatopsis xylanica]SDY04419.1 acetoacetate decarboxylase [Amycolatopsis xylanica]